MTFAGIACRTTSLGRFGDPHPCFCTVPLHSNFQDSFISRHMLHSPGRQSDLLRFCRPHWLSDMSTFLLQLG